MQQFTAWIKTISEPLAKYFEKEYVIRAREWAACFRVGSRANTNMFVERFHRTLKKVYLEKKQNRRVDHLIFKLRKIARDKAFKQLIKAEKGKSTLRQRESIKRHKQGELVKKEAVHKQDDDLWNVLLASKTGTVHHVGRISATCSCVMKCPSCEVCVHTCECSCANYGIRGVLCSHIHAVNILYPKPIVDLEGDVVLKTTSDIDIEKKHEDLPNLIQQDKKLEESKQLSDLKTYALNQIAELTDLIQNAPTKDTIKTTLWHIRSAISVAKGLTVIGSDHQYLRTKLFPANKLYEKQKRFFSTKKKRKVERKKAKLSDATAKELEDTEVQVCAFCFKEIPPGVDQDTFEIEWIECETCKCWVHEICDHIPDKANYICCMCRTKEGNY